jgi:beta-lactamase regulating signal transducer with metallopeptidase domain
MSGLELGLRNLLAWSLQAGVLSLVAAVAGRLVPVDRPAARLALARALLALVVLLPLVQPWTAASAVVDVSFGLIGPAAIASPGSVAAPTPARSLVVLVVAAALAGVAAIRLCLLGLRLLRLRTLGTRSRPLRPEPWLTALRDEVAPRASFALCDGAAIPATYGARRPRILLPAFFAAMPRDRQRAVALHELLHARRADWLSLLAEEALKAVLFFHPAVHWLVDRVRVAREQWIDAEVVRRLGAREAYLESLVEVARHASSSRAVPAAALLRESHLRERVDLLLKEVRMSRTRTCVHVALTAAAVLLAVSWAASALPLQAPAATAKDAAVAVADEVAAPSEPKLVRKVNPAYPPEAKAEHVEGIYRIDVVIGKDGAIKDAKVTASAPTPERLKALDAQRGAAAAVEGDPRLAEAALVAVRQWQYEPILKDGRPVEVRATVHVRFKLS